MLALVNTPSGEHPAQLREVSEPSAAPDEALVEVRAFSLNRGELSLLAGRPEGWRPGQDVSGVVVRAARDGGGPPEGARVVGLVDEAGWAERVAVPASNLAVLPEGVDFSEAATLPIAGLTALRALRRGGQLLGGRVLVTGASGGVGHLAVQLAAASGASVTAVAGGHERGEGLVQLGATEVVANAEDAEGPFGLILESAGGPSLEAAMRRLAPGGTLVVFGNSSRQGAGLDFFDFFGLYPEGARIEVFFFASGTRTAGEDLGALTALVAAGKLAPKVGWSGSWKDLARGVEALQGREVAGKAVFHVD